MPSDQKASTNAYNHFFKGFPTINKIKSVLRKNSDSITVFCRLIHSDIDFYEKYFVDEIVECIRELNDITKPSLRLLLRGYVNQFDNHTQKLNLENKTKLFKFFHEKNLIDYSQIEKIGLLKSKPVKKVVSYSIKNSTKPIETLKRCGIDINWNSTFYKLLETEFILKWLKENPLDAEQSFPTKILDHKIYYRRLNNSLLAGHQIIKNILDNESEKHDSWIKMILQFAGDPRTKEGRVYQKWWGALEKKYLITFKDLLPPSNIRLFLEAIKEFAVNNHNMNRMFPSRKVFLEGLENQNLIVYSRLFLPKEVKNFIREKYPTLDLTFICNLVIKTQREKNKSIIYLNLGELHIFEGSHAFSIRVYRQSSPKSSHFISPNCKNIEITELRNELLYNLPDLNDSNSFKAEDHNGQWKLNVIQFMREYLPEFHPKPLFTQYEWNRFGAKHFTKH
ncbi:MAG: EH signature domain-containing protein [Flavobacteriaceae bacterium]|nr:EH signature domain-containing protein [Flavobacteriaceae bacterium]